jgi:hypothetical protein
VTALAAHYNGVSYFDNNINKYYINTSCFTELPINSLAVLAECEVFITRSVVYDQ